MTFQENKKFDKQKFQFAFVLLCVAFIFLFFLDCFESAEINSAKAAKDAVAIRIIPNPKHQSPSSWYKEQGFTGSPQKTIVDGYEAIIDGRTVYANVANIDGGVLYTNIYLISYNQEPDQGTADFFSRLVLNWKFNTNEVWEGRCNDNVDIVCVKDVDCGFDDYCTGKKAQIIRDVRRLSDLYEMNNAMTAFHDEHGLFPSVKSGSYLRSISISNWPSWKKVLSQTVGLSMPIDPVNELGLCVDGVSGLVDERFHEVTCWDNDLHEFADGDLADLAFNLPDNSKTYVYQSFENGIRYELCAVMESGYVTGLTNGACDGSATFEYEDIHGNRPPIFVGGFGTEESSVGQEYTHYVKAIDPDGDELTWEIDTSSEAWVGWSAAPELQDVPPIDEKRIFASQIGISGDYTYTVIVRDGRGGEAQLEITTRAINMYLPRITKVTSQAGVVLYDTAIGLTGIFNVGDIVIGNSMNLRIEGEEAESQYPLSFEFNGFSIITEEMADFAGTTLIQSAGILEDDTGVHLINLYVYDAYRGRSETAVSFNVTIINNAPIISSTPVITTEGCADYSYQAVASDPDGHDIGYSFINNTDLPFTGSLLVSPLTGLCQGTPIVADSADYDIDLSVRDEYYAETNVPYSAEDVQSFVLTVTDESYAVNNIEDRDIYNDPGVDGVTYYHPLTYFETYGSTADYPDDVLWSGTGLPAGFSINPTTGDASWTPNAAQDGNTYQIDVDARNQCNVLKEESYNLNVLQNEWCGDDIIQSAFTEQCEVADLDGETCLTFGYDGGVLNCNLCNFDFVSCCMADCGTRNCDISPNGCASCGDPRNIDCTNGKAICDPLYQSCSGDPSDADGCECYLNPGQFQYCFDGSGDANIKLLLQGYQFVDDSSFGHAINNNGVTINATTFSGLGRSMYFNGGTDNIRVADSNDWDMINGDFTIDAWFRLDVINQDQVIAYQGNGSAPDWTFFYSASEGLSFCARSSAGDSWFNDCNDLVGTTTDWAINTWYHVAVVREGNVWDLYKNGSSVANVIETRTDIPDIAQRLYIGADSDNNRNIIGYLDEFRISKGRALWTSLEGPNMVNYNGAGVSCIWFVSSWACL